jgi:LPS export ABC transporter protein LptC
MQATSPHSTPSGPALREDLFRREHRRRPLSWWLALALFLAAGGLVAFFLWRSGIVVERRATPPKVEVTVSDQGVILVRNPDITGLDEEDLPFELRARLSRRVERQPDLVHLEEVSGVLRRRNGERIHLRADRAVYDRRREQAVLIGNVRIYTPGRFDLRTTRARVEVPRKLFVVEEPVTVRLNDGVIRAGGMRTRRNSDRVFFTGRVHATFGTGEDLR